jgi:hypothetical protein
MSLYTSMCTSYSVQNSWPTHQSRLPTVDLQLLQGVGGSRYHWWQVNCLLATSFYLVIYLLDVIAPPHFHWYASFKFWHWLLIILIFFYQVIVLRHNSSCLEVYVLYVCLALLVEHSAQLTEAAFLGLTWCCCQWTSGDWFSSKQLLVCVIDLMSKQFKFLQVQEECRLFGTPRLDDITHVGISPPALI